LPTCGKGHSIAVHLLDGPVWDFALQCLRYPSMVTTAAEAALAHAPEPEAALAGLDEALRNVTRQEERIADAIADGGAIPVLTRKLAALAEQKEGIQRDREDAANQAAARAAAQLTLTGLREEMSNMLDRAGELDYDGKREVLERLGLRVTVSKLGSGRADRWTVSLNLQADVIARVVVLLGRAPFATGNAPTKGVARMSRGSGEGGHVLGTRPGARGYGWSVSYPLMQEDDWSESMRELAKLVELEKLDDNNDSGGTGCETGEVGQLCSPPAAMNHLDRPPVNRPQRSPEALFVPGGADGDLGHPAAISHRRSSATRTDHQPR
jgi:hypothetical protein